MRDCLIIIAGVLATWAVAAPAFATFPGANGMLAVSPRTGNGIVLVSPNGSGEHRVCAATAACARSANPSWSPDGQELMFTDPGIEIVYTDGSCLDCDFGVAASPAFKPDGTQVSFVKAQTVSLDGIDRTSEGSTGVAGTDAVWSAGGRLAVVRGGQILVGLPGDLKRVASGSEPSWSPTGLQLAAEQKGWVVVIAVGTGRVRRLVKGSAPAFSPDGQQIAFIATNHRLMTVAAAGGVRPVSVGDIDAASVAWQPIRAARSRSCQTPPGSTVLARSPAAVISGDDPQSESGPGAVEAVMGCLLANGRERLLAFAGSGDVDDAAAFTFGGLAPPFVALVRSDTDDHYGGSSATVDVFDLNTGREAPQLGGERASCQSECVGDLRDLVIDSAGATAAVTYDDVPAGTLTTPLTELGCAPDGSVCVTSATADYTVFAAAAPAAGSSSWKPTTLPGISGQIEFSGARGLACPSSALCVAVGASDVWTITSGGGWTGSALGSTPIPNLDQLTCPSTSLCVAGGLNGRVGVTTDPAAGASAWQLDDIDTGADLFAPACNPGGTCSVSTSDGVYVATDPAGGTDAWQPSAGAPSYEAESCPTNTFCALITSADQIATANAPGSGTQTQTTSAFAGALKDISCPTESFCAAISTGDTLETSTDPVGGAWTASTLPDTTPLEAIDCTSATACVITDERGQVLTSADPGGGASDWTSTLVDGNPCNVTTPCSDEVIQANGGTGDETAATSTISGTGPYVSDLKLSGEVLTWDQNGTPESTTLTPGP